NHRALLVSDVKLTNVSRLGAVLRLRLHEYLPHAAEAVELVDVIAAKQGLQRAVHVFDRNAELEDLVLVNRGKHLRNRRVEHEVHRPQLGPFFRRGKELLRVIPEIIDGFTGPILNEEIDTAGLADAGNRRRQESKSLGLGQRRQLAVYVSHDR